jgi:microcin C transport system permease protein
VDSTYRGAQGLDPEFIAELERQFGFDKPAHERFMADADRTTRRSTFGESYFRDISR